MKEVSFNPDFKIFCDESCHLENDGINLMVLGALCCTADETEAVISEIKKLRQHYNYQNEIKWTKLIRKQLPFYKALINLLIESPSLKFKATVVLNKSNLDHEQYNDGSHGTFYYKMFFYTLSSFLQQGKSYRVYMDYMDTHGAKKSATLSEVLTSKMHGSIRLGVHINRSHESQLIQLCDLLTGAIGYKNRSDILKESVIKNEIIDHIEARLRRSLNYGTPQWEEKFNIFMFSPRSRNV